MIRSNGTQYHLNNVQLNPFVTNGLLLDDLLSLNHWFYLFHLVIIGMHFVHYYMMLILLY